MVVRDGCAKDLLSERGLNVNKYGLSKRSPFSLEKGLHQGSTFIFQNAFLDFYLMIQACVCVQVKTGAGGPSLGVSGSKDQFCYSGLDKGTHAHGTRLDGHVQGRAQKPVISNALRGRAKGEDFRMSRWITKGDGLIMGPGENMAAMVDQNGANRNLIFL
jgi:hypothetical protein